MLDIFQTICYPLIRLNSLMILNIIQIIVSVILIAVILLQNRGTGLGAAFGGEGNIYRTKRGMEKTLHIATIVLVVFFLATAVLNVIY
jgi:preprotein translocase subunit SecG